MDNYRKFSVTFAAFLTLIGFQNGTSVPIASDSNGTGLNKLNETSAHIKILYDTDSFKEIHSGVLQFVGADVSKVSLSCMLASDEDAFLSWKYHGIEEKNVRRQKNLADENGLDLDLSSGPPVVRMECFWRRNKTISANTLIYTGENQSPYFFKNEKTLRATVLNLHTAHLPCLLKYPLDHNGDDKELQLFKDGKLVKNDALSYIPERGYHLNLKGLENPLGTYECRVSNSANDVVFVELDNGTFINVEYKGHLEKFYAGEPFLQPFECKLPKDMYEYEFKWSYLWKDGRYTPLNVKDVTNSSDASNYMQRVKITFPETNIVGVVCASTIQDSESSYNNSYRVDVNQPYPPRILNPKDDRPIIYVSGMNLTCVTITDPVTFHWLKNGKDLNNGEHIIESHDYLPYRSSVKLNPTPDDEYANYTCIVSNFLGNATLMRNDYRVQLNTTQEVVPNCITTISATLTSKDDENNIFIDIITSENHTNRIDEIPRFIKWSDILYLIYNTFYLNG
ncbi:unnamed protein product [Orchesella dallaii]|uniref:Ig-like domain-containing protein n=1 Tax=Orchesella dallaii TaxID=48710 RepID=A0ABP1Q5A5_9HEXA